jgi:hypothetical protein
VSSDGRTELCGWFVHGRRKEIGPPRVGAALSADGN